MSQRHHVIPRAVVWRPDWLGGAVDWLIGIGGLATREAGPLIAAGAGAAVGAATELRHSIAKKAGAIGEPFGASAPRPAHSPNGPSACPLCCGRY